MQTNINKKNLLDIGYNKVSFRNPDMNRIIRLYIPKTIKRSFRLQRLIFTALMSMYYVMSINQISHDWWDRNSVQLRK